MASRLERLVKHVGEENLPPKLAQATQPEVTDGPTEENPINKLQSVEDFAQQHDDSNEWWNATPQLPQPPPKQPQTKPAAVPFTSNNGGLKFSSDTAKGAPAPLGLPFTPTGAVFKFCYKFVRKELTQRIASAFFDESKIQNREWDVYYIWSDHFASSKPLTFVPEEQLLTLVDEINQHFPDAKITISDELREDGLAINFDEFSEYPDLRPRYLGHSTSRAQLEYWTDEIGITMPTKSAMAVPERTLEAFRAKMELASEIQKNKTKAAKKRRQEETVVKRQDMVRMSLRVQRYLGLMTKAEDSLMPNISTLSITPVDVTKACAHGFDSDVIFIAIDCEAYERSPRVITEVGVATLDTRDLHGMAPGTETGTAWQQYIRARHFRIAEYKNYTNSEFVSGCPDRFEFGKSEFVGKDLISKKLAECFKQPYSGSAGSSMSEERRTIVFVGHNVSQDISYLRQIGFSLSNYGNVIIDNIDTAQMFRAYCKEPEARSLGTMLNYFDLQGWYLHNAGNDAVYTLWAMLAICVKTAAERGTDAAAAREAQVLEKKRAEAIERAQERVNDELQGWEVDDDGGVPVPPADAKPIFGPPRKENQVEGHRGLFTSGGAPLDVREAAGTAEGTALLYLD